MAPQHLISGKPVRRRWFSASLASSWATSAWRVHLCNMETTAQRHGATETSGDLIEPVITLSHLAMQLGVSIQTLYDLRTQGRGPRGFRVGREIRFRVSEVESWLGHLEAEDAARQQARTAG